MCTAKGSDVRPGVPRAPRLLRGRHGPPPLLRGRRGTMCAAKGSDIRFGRRGTCTYSLTHSLMQDGWIVDG